MKKNGNDKDDLKLMRVINNHKKLICVLIASLYIIIILLSAAYFGFVQASLEKLYYVSQVISGMFVITGVVVAIIQYTFNSNANRVESDKQRKIEAARMANEFRLTVIPLINKLAIAYSDKNLKESIIEYLEKCTLNDFDKAEVERLFPDDKILEYRVQLGYHYALETNVEFKSSLMQFLLDKEIPEKEKECIKKKLDDMVSEAVYEVSVLSTELANTLEYLCICFNTNIADEKTVYQSLHKVFFLGVHMIYIFTFDANESESDRLYYNIMILYKKWKRLYEEKRKEEAEAEQKIKYDIDNMRNKYKENITVRPENEYTQ